MAQARPDQSIQAFWRCVEPVDQVLQCSFKTLAGWRLEVQRFPADRPGYHLHRFIATQLADPDGAQPIRARGEQGTVPRVQAVQAQWRLEIGRGCEQRLHQAVHLGARPWLLRLQRELQAACHRGAHFGGIQLLTFDACSAGRSCSASQRNWGQSGCSQIQCMTMLAA